MIEIHRYHRNFFFKILSFLFSGDFDSRGKSVNRNGATTRGKRRSKASHNIARRRQKSLTAATVTSSETNGGCGESRLEPESFEKDSGVPSRLRKAGLRNRKKGKLKVRSDLSNDVTVKRHLTPPPKKKDPPKKSTSKGCNANNMGYLLL